MAVFQDITPRGVKMRWGPKNPGDTVDYWVNMAYWLPSDPVDVDAVAVTVTVADTLDQPPPGPGFTHLIVIENELVPQDWIRVRFSGGSPGNDYPVYFTVTANTGEVYPFTCELPVEERRTL